MIPITAITPTNVAKYFDASGKSIRLNRISPYVPTFNRSAARSTEPAVGASVCASGSQVCSGTNGTFTANATKNARNSHRAVVDRQPAADVRSARRIRTALGAALRGTGTGSRRSRKAEPAIVNRKNLIAA